MHHFFIDTMMISKEIATTETVICQNQVAVDCINAQDYQTAVISSTSALRCQRSIIDLHREKCSPPSELTYDQCILLTNIDEKNDKDAEGCQSYIYDHGISLHVTATGPNIITPIAIINCALAFQLLAGQSHEEASIHYLHKAKRLYSLAYDAPHIDENPLFQFVIINNLAVVARRLGNERAWKTSMDSLLSLYMTLVDQGCTAILRQVQGFLVNALPSSPIAQVA